MGNKLAAECFPSCHLAIVHELFTLCQLYALALIVYLLYQVSISNPFDNPITKRLYDEWLGQPGSENSKKYLHTDYHPVVKSVASQLQNW